MDKKQEILKAAFDIFSQKGYQLSVAEIAASVNIKTPSLYSHFGSKDEIIEQVIRHEIDRFYSQLSRTMSETGSECEQTMKAIFCFVIDYFSKENRLRFWRAIPHIPNPKLKRICTDLIMHNDGVFHEVMQDCFSAGKARGEIRPEVLPGALRLYLCMIQGVLDGILMPSKGVAERRAALEIFDAYWDGISQKPDRPKNRTKETSDHGL